MGFFVCSLDRYTSMVCLSLRLTIRAADVITEEDVPPADRPLVGAALVLNLPPGLLGEEDFHLTQLCAGVTSCQTVG